MSDTSTLALFRQSGALLDGHFRLSSGLHSSGYLQSALVLQYPDRAETLGLIIGQEVGRALGVRAIFSERQDGAMVLRRGFSIAPDDRVVIIEDVVTTGGSTRETMAVVTAASATTVGAGAIIDRSNGASNLGVPFRALASFAPPVYQPDACPMCAAGDPVVKPGSRT
jgi:orotate phosphoribosyltransferase